MRFIATVACLALATTLSAATLSSARRVATAFEFSITGASNAIYAIEASRDLQNWTRVATNRHFGELRTISLPSSASEEFYRVRPVRPLFTGAFGVRESIDFAGGGVTVNSFDSADPSFSDPDGRYDPSKFRDRGDIITSSALTNSLNLGNGKVYGKVRAPADDVAVLGLGGAVGSILWHLNGGRGIEPGWLVQETNRVFVDAELPQGHNYLTPGSGVVDGISYRYVLTNGLYALPELRVSSMLVTGRATLYVAGLVEVRGLMIRQNASLDLYVGGATATISGVDNRNAAASTFAYYGLPGNTNIYVGGNAAFLGTIYAPAADIRISGGGNDIVDIIGAIVGRNITISGKANLHYDESLAVAGPAL